MFEKAEQKLSD